MSIPQVSYFQNTTLQGLGVDLVRRRIHTELDELNNFLTPENDFCIQSIITWKNSLRNAIQHPRPLEVVRQYLIQFENILRNPASPDAPFSAELFGDKALPVIQCMVAKMRNPQSVLYSASFDQAALRILMEARRRDQFQEVQQVLLEQLRQMEAIHIRLNHEQDALINSALEPMLNMVRQQETASNEHITRIARQHIDTVNRLLPRVEQIRQNDLEQRVIHRETITRLQNQARDADAEVEQLQRQLTRNSGQLDELSREAVQLQVRIKEVESHIAKNKEGWLESIACIAASIAISWALKRPVIITPNSVNTF